MPKLTQESESKCKHIENIVTLNAQTKSPRPKNK